MQSNHKPMALNYADLELRVFAEFAGNGEIHMEPKRNLSQIYGTKAGEIRNLVTEESHRLMTLTYIKTFPGAVQRFPGLRKVKAKAMVNALIHGHAENGNHFVTCYGNDYHFFYRGTLIYKWNAVSDEGTSVHAGAYEETASTRNQRKEIEKSIQNFKEAVTEL